MDPLGCRKRGGIMEALMPAALRMLYVTQDDLSKHSGYAYRVDRLRRAFERAGASVDVLGYCASTPAIVCTAIRSRSRLRRLWPLWRGLVTPAQYIIITSIGAPYNGVYALLARAAGKRVIYDVHDPVQLVLPQLFGDGPFMRLAMPVVALSEALVGRVAHATIAASATAQELYRKRGWRGTIGLAYNLRAQTAPPPHEPPVDLRADFGWKAATIVVYAGGLQRGVRGIERQIEAVAAARAQGIDAVLLLLGYGDRAYFESLGGDLVRDGSLRFLSDVSPDRMSAILKQCDLAVSCEPLGYLMPSKYFDYVAAGVRIIAIDDNRDVVRSLGAFVDRYDGSTAALVEYLAKKPLRMDEQQTVNARQYVRSLDRASDDVARAIITGAPNRCDEHQAR